MLSWRRVWKSFSEENSIGDIFEFEGGSDENETLLSSRLGGEAKVDDVERLALEENCLKKSQICFQWQER